MSDTSFTVIGYIGLSAKFGLSTLIVTMGSSGTWQQFGIRAAHIARMKKEKPGTSASTSSASFAASSVVDIIKLARSTSISRQTDLQ